MHFDGKIETEEGGYEEYLQAQSIKQPFPQARSAQLLKASIHKGADAHQLPWSLDI